MNIYLDCLHRLDDFISKFPDHFIKTGEQQSMNNDQYMVTGFSVWHDGDWRSDEYMMNDDRYNKLQRILDSDEDIG